MTIFKLIFSCLLYGARRPTARALLAPIKHKLAFHITVATSDVARAHQGKPEASGEGLRASAMWWSGAAQRRGTRVPQRAMRARSEADVACYATVFWGIDLVSLLVERQDGALRRIYISILQFHRSGINNTKLTRINLLIFLFFHHILLYQIVYILFWN